MYTKPNNTIAAVVAAASQNNKNRRKKKEYIFYVLNFHITVVLDLGLKGKQARNVKWVNESQTP